MIAHEYDLVGMREIAERLGVKPSTVMQWRSRKYLEFPLPFTYVTKTPIWNYVDVEVWAKKHGRLPEADT